jgi:hypothetical protein
LNPSGIQARKLLLHSPDRAGDFAIVIAGAAPKYRNSLRQFRRVGKRIGLGRE